MSAGEPQLFPQHLDSQLFPEERLSSEDHSDESPPSCSPCDNSFFPEEAEFSPGRSDSGAHQQPSSFRRQNRFDVLADEDFENPLEAAASIRSRLRAEKSSAAAGDKKWAGWPGENVFRLVVPLHKVGAIIGRKGELVRKMCEDTRAKIKILDGVLGATERIVLITAREEPDSKLSPAMDAFLKVHKRILDAGVESGEVALVTSRLLVHVAQAGSLIGRQGSTIKQIQDTSHATVRVLSEESVPPYALEVDRVVEIYGELQKVHHAVQLVIGHLRRFLVDRSVLPLFDNNRLKNENAQCQAPAPAAANVSVGAARVSNGTPVQNAARVAAGSAPGSGSVLSQAKVKQVLRLPLSCSDAIIGTSGANISYMRRTSGASITVEEIGDELCVEVEGTGQQVHLAQQLTENFVQQYAP